MNVYKYTKSFMPFSAVDSTAIFTIDIYKIYRMCFATIKWVGATNLTDAYFSEITIPSAFRPIGMSVYCTAQHISSGNAYDSATRLMILTNGSVYFNTSSMERFERCVSVSYVSNKEIPDNLYLIN